MYLARREVKSYAFGGMDGLGLALIAAIDPQLALLTMQEIGKHMLSAILAAEVITAGARQPLEFFVDEGR